MPNNLRSQKGFVETLALLGIGLILLTIPLAQKLASERQEIRNYAQEQPECATENKCPRANDPSPIQQCYSWAGSGCAWNGSSCYCKLNEAQAPAPAPQQPSSTDQVCKTIGQPCQDPDYPEACKTEDGKDGTKRCHKEGLCTGVGGQNECPFSTGSYCGECTTDQPTLPKEAPVAITSKEGDYSPGPCGGNGNNACNTPENPKGTLCMCKYTNGAWQVAEASKQTGYPACCSNAALTQTEIKNQAREIAEKAVLETAEQIAQQATANGTGFFCEKGSSVTKVNGQVTKTEPCPVITGCDQLTGKCVTTTANCETVYCSSIYASSQITNPDKSLRQRCISGSCSYYQDSLCSTNALSDTAVKSQCGYLTSAPQAPTADFTGWKCESDGADGSQRRYYVNNNRTSTIEACPNTCKDATECNQAVVVPAPAAPANQTTSCASIDTGSYTKSDGTKVCCNAAYEIPCPAPAEPTTITTNDIYSCNGNITIRKKASGAPVDSYSCTSGLVCTTTELRCIPAPAAPANQTTSCASIDTGSYTKSDGTKVCCNAAYEIPCPIPAPAAPAQPAAQTRRSCTEEHCGKDNTIPYVYGCEGDFCSYFLNTTDCTNNTNRIIGVQNYCNPAPAAAQTLPAGAGKNPCYGQPDDLPVSLDGKTVCCSSGSVVACPATPTKPTTEQANTVYLPTIQTGETTNQGQPNPQPETFKPILCSMTKCPQSDKTYFINCTATGDCTTYKNYPCINATLLSDPNTYCSEPQTQESITNTPPKPTTSTTRSISEFVSNALCITPPISWVCRLLGYVPF